MTIIAAIKKRGHMWLASDRLVSWGDFVRADAANNSKLVWFRNAIIGSSGRCVYNNALHYLAYHDEDTSYFNAPFENEADVTAFFFRFYGFVKDKYNLGSANANDVSGMSNSQFIVITAKHIFHVSSLRDVLVFDNYSAIGSGSDTMMSAMHALNDVLDSPRDILQRAYDTCTHFISSCGGELELHHVNRLLPYDHPGRTPKKPRTSQQSRKAAAKAQQKPKAKKVASRKRSS